MEKQIPNSTQLKSWLLYCPKVLGYSDTTQLLEQGTDLRYIQELLGHNSSKTTENYTHVSKKAIDRIRNPVDKFFEKDFITGHF